MTLHVLRRLTRKPSQSAKGLRRTSKSCQEQRDLQLSSPELFKYIRNDVSVVAKFATLVTRLNIKGLEAFSAIMSVGSLSSAAAQLHVSVPALEPTTGIVRNRARIDTF